jgi:hypothetical protein
MLTSKKGPRIRADRFLYRSDGNLVEHDLAVWSSVSRVDCSLPRLAFVHRRFGTPAT